MSSFIYSPFERSLTWPHKCAVCYKSSEFNIDTSITDISDSGMTWYKIRKRSLRYPICRRHRFFCFIFDLPQRNSLIWWILAILPIALIGFIRKFIELISISPLNTAFSKWFILLTYAVIFLYLFTGKYLLPVRLSKVDNHRMKISFKNEDFFTEVKKMNSDIISVD